jgi:flagellar biosynthesis chaperone FliJ
MPEEFEGAADPGMGSGEGGGPEPAGESAQAPAPSAPAQPNYMTREAFDEAISGFGQQYQERLDHVSSSFTSMQDMIKQLIEASKPAQPPLIPEAEKLQNIDAHGFRTLLSTINEKHERAVADLQKQLESTRNEWKQEQMTRQIYNHFSEQAKTVSAQHPHLQKPYGQQLLQKMIIAEIESSKGNYRKVNVQAIGQALNSYIEETVADRMKQKMPAPQATPGAQVRGPDGKFVAPKAPPKGAGTKPGEKPGGGVNLKNFSSKMREMIEANFPQASE